MDIIATTQPLPGLGLNYRAIARDVTTTPLRHFGAQPDFAVYGRDGELCCC